SRPVTDLSMLRARAFTSGTSEGSSSTGSVRLCRRALRATIALPASVRGPVLLRALRRLARIFARLVMGLLGGARTSAVRFALCATRARAIQASERKKRSRYPGHERHLHHASIGRKHWGGSKPGCVRRAQDQFWSRRHRSGAFLAQGGNRETI